MQLNVLPTTTFKYLTSIKEEKKKTKEFPPLSPPAPSLSLLSFFSLILGEIAASGDDGFR